MDEILRELYQRWQLFQLTTDGIEFLSALLRSGEPLELTDYPWELIKEFLTYNPKFASAPNIMLQGHLVPNILARINQELELLIIDIPESDRQSFQNQLGLLRAFCESRGIAEDLDYTVMSLVRFLKENFYSTAVVWYPFRHTDEENEPRTVEFVFSYDRFLRPPSDSSISIYCASQESTDESLGAAVTVSDEGEIRVPERGPSLEAYFVEFIFNLRTGHIERILPRITRESGFWQNPSLEIESLFGPEQALDDQRFFDHDESYNEHLILLDEIDASDFEIEIPSLEYDRCEDYPACEHDMCPPTFGGRQIAKVCVCGKYLPMGRRFSICDDCLESRDDEFYERDGEHIAEDENEKSENEDEDEDEPDMEGWNDEY